jgi:hypothetical protein
MPTTMALQRHAQQLCCEHDIVWRANLPRVNTFALRVCEEIDTPPIRGAVSYAVVLHEIGHILGRYQDSRHTIVRERWAWAWARRHALMWTPAMERCAVASLAWYAPRADRLDKGWREPEIT